MPVKVQAGRHAVLRQVRDELGCYWSLVVIGPDADLYGYHVTSSARFRKLYGTLMAGASHDHARRCHFESGCEETAPQLNLTSPYDVLITMRSNVTSL